MYAGHVASRFNYKNDHETHDAELNSEFQLIYGSLILRDVDLHGMHAVRSNGDKAKVNSPLAVPNARPAVGYSLSLRHPAHCRAARLHYLIPDESPSTRQCQTASWIR